jgi:hypothetical protein
MPIESISIHLHNDSTSNLLIGSVYNSPYFPSSVQNSSTSYVPSSWVLAFCNSSFSNDDIRVMYFPHPHFLISNSISCAKIIDGKSLFNEHFDNLDGFKFGTFVIINVDLFKEFYKVL